MGSLLLRHLRAVCGRLCSRRRPARGEIDEDRDRLGSRGVSGTRRSSRAPSPPAGTRWGTSGPTREAGRLSPLHPAGGLGRRAGGARTGARAGGVGQRQSDRRQPGPGIRARRVERRLGPSRARAQRLERVVAGATVRRGEGPHGDARRLAETPFDGGRHQRRIELIDAADGA